MDYQDGFEDGVKFAREVIVTNIRLWAETSDDSLIRDDRIKQKRRSTTTNRNGGIKWETEQTLDSSNLTETQLSYTGTGLDTIC